MSDGQLLGTTGGRGRVLRFDGGHYVVEMQGHFDASHLSQALRLVRADSKGRAESVIFAEGDALESYDRSILTYYERSTEPFEVGLVGVVLRSPLLRMVARAAGLGLVAFSRVRFDVYETLEEALRATQRRR
ncbi:MAG: hypothetical protein M5U28_00575 [Sandaracinaceae bacterium]|nr:hypothetical protein [Sandaracinaceae bacterium]